MGDKSNCRGSVAPHHTKMKKKKKQPKKQEGFWTLYNKSQTKEKPMFIEILREICNALPAKYKTRGKHKKALHLNYIIFCVCMRAYCLKSGRRLIGELALCKKMRFINRIPHFNTIFNYLKSPELTFVLQELIQLASLPLKAIERKFASDSSGFSNSILHDRWSVIRQNYSKHHKYFKAHITYGVLTNIVTSCRITEGTRADSPMLAEMIDETAKNFKMEEVSADKAYLSRNNLEKIWEKGALPLIPFKFGITPKKKGFGIWREMYDFFEKNNELFMKKYHLRSNAESGFMMIKSRFGDLTQMRDETGAKNDVLVKVLCHNICVLIQEIFLLGIEFDFAQIFKDSAQD